MLKNTLVLASAICMIAPAMAETEETPTHAQVIDATKALLEGATEILDSVTDAESAKAAAGGLDQLTAMAKEVSKAAAALPEPSEEEVKALHPAMGSLMKAQAALEASIKKVMESEFATDELKKAIADFGTAFGG